VVTRNPAIGREVLCSQVGPPNLTRNLTTQWAAPMACDTWSLVRPRKRRAHHEPASQLWRSGELDRPKVDAEECQLARTHIASPGSW
jgi:hypothetical protein